MGFLDKLLQGMGGGHHGGGRGDHRGGRHGYPSPTGQAYVAPSGGGLTCTSCAAVNPPGARFCAQCGKSFVPGTCSNCGSGWVAEAKFCANCGKPQT